MHSTRKTFWTCLLAVFSASGGVASIFLAQSNSAWLFLTAVLVIAASLGTIAVTIRGTSLHPSNSLWTQPSDGSINHGVPACQTFVSVSDQDETPNGAAASSQSLINRQWQDLVDELVLLLDELEAAHQKLAPEAKELAEHIEARLEEILIRTGVKPILNESTFDRLRHQPVAGSSVNVGKGALVETIRPGLVLGRRVLRRAIVRLTDNTPLG